MELVRVYSKQRGLADELRVCCERLSRLVSEDLLAVSVSVRSTGRVGRLSPAERLSESEQQELVDAFIAGAKQQSLAVGYGVSLRTIRRFLSSRGIGRRDRG